MLLRTLLVTAAFVAATTLAASAEGSSTSKPAAGAKASGTVSAATHCLDANGQIQLKSAMKGKSGSATTGSGSRASKAGGQKGQTGSAAANLPSC
jgi:hypothetical protein